RSGISPNCKSKSNRTIILKENPLYISKSPYQNCFCQIKKNEGYSAGQLMLTENNPFKCICILSGGINGILIPIIIKMKDYSIEVLAIGRQGVSDISNRYSTKLAIENSSNQNSIEIILHSSNTYYDSLYSDF